MATPTESTKATAYNWSGVEQEQVKPDLGRRLITGAQVMLAQVDLQRGCIVPQHAHVHEQITQVIRGCLRLTVGEDAKESYDLRAGDVLVLPSNVPHAGEALEDTQVIDVFSPPREDWLNRTDAYLRKR